MMTRPQPFLTRCGTKAWVTWKLVQTCWLSMKVKSSALGCEKRLAARPASHQMQKDIDPAEFGRDGLGNGIRLERVKQIHALRE